MPLQRWTPTTTISAREKYILKRCQKKRRLFSFLREHRSELFDDALQQELEAMYRNTGAGRDPLCPALMAMALILQGYLGVSDADAVELTVVDLRWQMVLDCLGAEAPAFSQGALHDFRQRLIANDMDRRLLERTAELARATRGFDAKKLPRTLRIGIDSSPLSGAGRVEDTLNLVGHAARKVAECAVQLLECEYSDFCRKAGIPLLLDKSVKKALDCDWSDNEQKAAAVDELAKQVLSLERWIAKHLATEADSPPLQDLLAVLQQLMDQDLEPDPSGGGMRIRNGTAEDRRISIEDGEMRHGRKSKSKRVNGYKRHIAADLDSQAIVACAVTPANQPEHEALPRLKADIEAQKIHISEAHFDRGYMGSTAVDELESEGAAILCKPWRPHNTRNAQMYTKRDFSLDLRSMTMTCPGGQTESMRPGHTLYFDSSACDRCRLRSNCTTARRGTGRSVAIADDEARQEKLRRMLRTKSGRDRFRERVPIEHRLAHISHRQGNNARYMGARKNLYDLRRAAVIQNLETMQRKAA